MNNKPRYLVVKGLAGLGNRLITLLSAADYAQAAGRRLHIDWSDGMFGPVRENVFYRFFELKNVDSEPDLSMIVSALRQGASAYPATLTPDALEKNIFATYDCVSSPLGRHPLYRVPLSVVAKGNLSALLGLQTWQPLAEANDGWRKALSNVRHERGFVLGSMLSRNIDRDIVVFADFRPFVRPWRIFDYVTLKKEYLDEFKEFASRHTLAEKGIGVHIRATDKTAKTDRDNLHKRLGKLIATSPERTIFLSSDNPDVVSEFQEAYPGHVVQYPKFMPDNPSGHGLHQWALWECRDGGIKTKMLHEALADMWILSMCRELYWQGNSSFSLISCQLKADKHNIHNWMRL